ncbi:N-formylglutamate amidohydrolase [Fodinicurvata halophila]|uniref:N-formylglutamate amidohydrolase n=1 Tax=Fodinicurvata halophila TaxID=1419723 RepID=A0ABV8UKT2_9PROT
MEQDAAQSPVHELFRGHAHPPRAVDREAVGEPPPFEFLCLSGASPVLIFCDHASRHIPESYAGLGLDGSALARHIAWDIGVADVAPFLARMLDAPTLLAGFSRLVIDPNRHLESQGSIPEISDETPVPGNRNLGKECRQQRVDAFFKPYHAAVARMIEAQLAKGVRPLLVFLHSFTPIMEGVRRPWQIGVLWNEDERLARPVIEGFRAQGCTVGENEPYSGASPEDYSLHKHGEGRGLAPVLLEVRQDLIDTRNGAEQWARIIAAVLNPLVAQADRLQT